MTEEKFTATEYIRNINGRHIRAEGLAGEIIATLHRFVAGACQREARATLAQAFEITGAQIVTDSMRRDLGLPPRGADGWTADELAALDSLRMGQIVREAPGIPFGTGKSPAEERLQRIENQLNTWLHECESHELESAGTSWAAVRDKIKKIRMA